MDIIKFTFECKCLHLNYTTVFAKFNQATKKENILFEYKWYFLLNYIHFQWEDCSVFLFSAPCLRPLFDPVDKSHGKASTSENKRE